MYRPIIISVEGNIGSGKSSLIQYISAKHPDWELLTEPVDEWLNMKDEHGNSILELFYSDKCRWAYTLQNYAYITRMRKIMELYKKKYDKPTVVLTERSILTDKNIFVEMLRKNGYLKPIERDMYLDWFNLLEEYAHIDGIVYLEATPETCMKRIIKRGRKGEYVEQEYLQSLHNHHTEWLSAERNILKLNGEPDIRDYPHRLEELCSQFEKYVHHLTSGEQNVMISC